MSTTRKPLAAVLLTLVTPGLGHLYSGRPRLGAWVFLASEGALALSCFIIVWLAGMGPLALVAAGAVALATLVAVCVHAAMSARRAPGDYPLQPYNRWWVYGGIWLVAAMVWQPALLATIKGHLVEAYRVPSSSMEPTILVGDFLFADRRPSARRAPAPGQVIVHESMTEPNVMVIKRVVGVGGDTLEMRDDVLIRNGVPQREPFTQHIDPGDDGSYPEMVLWQTRYLLPTVDQRSYHPTTRTWGPLVVPESQLFVLGDNRHNAYDSRYWGFVPVSRIRGTPLLIYYSYDPTAPSALPALTAIRWQRIGTLPWVVAPPD
jgi:signal peptidase I